MSTSSYRQLFAQLKRAAEHIPGQQEAAERAALMLVTQLAEPQRVRPCRVLLHGPVDGCAEALARAHAGVLEDNQGYSVLEIDCSQLRDSQEAGVLDGLPTMWSGARPGVVTSALYAKPRTVVLFLNLDRGLPRVMESLRRPLQVGVMTDNYGLPPDEHSDGEMTTEVDCSQAIFIFTASVGAEWHQHPELAELLGTNHDEACNTIRAALHAATREYRGHQVAVFDAPVLQQIEPNLVLLRPLGWAGLLDLAKHHLDEALSICANLLQLDDVVVSRRDREPLAAMQLLSQGADAGLAAASSEAFGRDLLAPLQRLSLGGPACNTRASLRLDTAARDELQRLLKALGPEPLRTLGRKSQVLRFEARWNARKAVLSFHALRLHAARRWDDYTGSVRLEAKVPEVTLDRVAGHSEAKAYFREIIGLLRDPEPLRRFGIDLPKGVVLVGPPGTGKTFLAQGFAGEAGLPCISVAGSDLLQPDQQRRVFELARRASPCVVFIDEADALGARGVSPAQDAALNKLLTEIQGFSSRAPVFHILATNRPEALDPALTRAGRIERQFYIGTLDRAGRSTLVERIAALSSDTAGAGHRLLLQSSGMTGAELERVRRECGLRLLRTGGECLSIEQVVEELNRVKYGESASGSADATARERLAVHEIGHALVHHILVPDIEIAQVSIVSRQGGVAGYMALNQDSAGWIVDTPRRVKTCLAVLLAGREAEVLRYGQVDGRSGGAAADLASATHMAWQAIAHSGMDDQFGCVSLLRVAKIESVPQAMLEAAWSRVRMWLDEAAAQAHQLLRQHERQCAELVERLLQLDTLEGAELEGLFRQNALPRPLLSHD